MAWRCLAKIPNLYILHFFAATALGTPRRRKRHISSEELCPQPEELSENSKAYPGSSQDSSPATGQQDLQKLRLYSHRYRAVTDFPFLILSEVQPGWLLSRERAKNSKQLWQNNYACGRKDFTSFILNLASSRFIACSLTLVFRIWCFSVIQDLVFTFPDSKDTQP